MNTFNRSLYHDLVPVSNLVETLEERSRSFWDQEAHSTDMMVDQMSGCLIVNGKAHQFQDQALRMLSNRLGIPGNYATKCPEDLLAYNMNYWLQSLNKQLLIRHDGQDIRAILSTAYNPVSNLDVIDVVAKYYADDPEVKVRYELNNNKMVAQFIGPTITSPVDPSDPCAFGMSISNSEVGYASVKSVGLLYRLVCKNGLMAGDSVEQWRRTHRYDADLSVGEMRESLNNLAAHLPNLLDDFMKSKEIELADPIATFELIRNSFNLAKIQLEQVQSAFLEEPEFSKFGVVNAITRAGNSKELTLEHRNELQRVGGHVLEMTEKAFTRVSA